MVDVVMGVLALLIGLLLCFRGRVAMRVLLALWGAFVGFGLGASLVAGLTGHGYLDSAAGWLAAIVLALVFAVLAYLFFAVAVVLAFASMGFVLGQTLAIALGAGQGWLITGVGVAVGVPAGGAGRGDEPARARAHRHQRFRRSERGRGRPHAAPGRVQPDRPGYCPDPHRGTAGLVRGPAGAGRPRHHCPAALGPAARARLGAPHLVRTCAVGE